MGSIRTFGVVLVALTALACSAPGSGRGAREPASLTDRDAPYNLADDNDLQIVRNQYDLLAVGAPARGEQRERLADEYARRMGRALEAGQRSAAYDELRALLALWEPAELADTEAVGAALAPYAASIRRMRKSFARSGGDMQVSLALFALTLVDPAQREAHMAELGQIFAFADELAVANYGDGAQRARPIHILEHVIEVFPVADAVDRLFALYVERQQAITSLWNRGSPDIQVLQAHGDGVFRTTWNIVRVAIRAGRIDEAPALVAGVTGVGDAPNLREALERALSDQATADDWGALAAFFVDPDPANADLDAAFRVSIAGSRRFPEDASLPRLAANIAAEDDHLPLAIHYTELAHERAPSDREIAEELARLYEIQISGLALSDRPFAALGRLEALEAFYARARKQWPEQHLARDLATAYAAMGRGMLSQGEIELALDYLKRSLSRRATHGALEQLGTLHLKQTRYEDAIEAFERALALEVQDADQRFARARIRRLLGEAYAALDQGEQATEQWAAGLDEWHTLLTRFDLPPRFQAEVFVESGRLMWNLDEREDARRAFDAAVDVDPDSASAYPDIVSFLIVRGEYGDALDAFHRALGASEIGSYFKVYMSLWVLAEARRTGRPDDPLATDYLATRSGELWHDQLARYAVGKVAYDPLLERANSRGRKAELYYYAATLSMVRDDPKRARKLLQRVIDTDMLLFFEYDMARYILDNALIEKSAAARALRQ